MNQLLESTFNYLKIPMHSPSNLLPAGINEALPYDAARLELLRRKLLNLLNTHAYHLCMPPLIEFINTDKNRIGSDIALATFQVTDQLSGKVMGFRSDMTPQIARMDLQISDYDAVTRLCYIGSILKTRPDNFGGSRSLIQLGAELYGNSNLESDLEVILLMISTLRAAGITQKITLDLGNVSIFNSLAKKHNLDGELLKQTFSAISQKAAHSLPNVLSTAAHQDFIKLLELTGTTKILEKALRYFPDIAAIHAIVSICASIEAFLPDINLHIDLTELRGYRYYTGLLFGAFIQSEGQAIALGGRYDNITMNKSSRAAVGFSTDLNKLLPYYISAPKAKIKTILAPSLSFNLELEEAVKRLRDAGNIVIRDLNQRNTQHILDHNLIFDEINKAWILD
ncbi:ATP phosphoribosyltransferase regulatory subunit [Gammaproteobacteria bacterium]|nr:ATP phosphoribosyltransferase regulatory subunit [Gammaproteobacteria bacterium]